MASITCDSTEKDFSTFKDYSNNISKKSNEKNKYKVIVKKLNNNFIQNITLKSNKENFKSKNENKKNKSLQSINSYKPFCLTTIQSKEFDVEEALDFEDFAKENIYEFIPSSEEELNIDSQINTKKTGIITNF